MLLVILLPCCCPTQDVLRTLTFVSRADEPATVQRSIVVSVDSAAPQLCRIVVSVALINDNAPVVDLNGPSEPSTNHSLSLTYDFMNQATGFVSSRDATISDADADGRVESLRVDLSPGLSGDGIFLHEDVGCPVDNSSTCHLRSARNISND